MDSRPSRTLIAALALLIGINLRPIMASIGPLLGILQKDLALTNTQASLLTALPVMMMGVFALGGPWLQRRIGENKGVAIGLLLIAAASGIRACVDHSSSLIATAALGGIGIAITQALMPAYIKRMYPESAGTLMGLFTTGIMAGAAIASAASAPIADHVGWRLTLGVPAIPAMITLAIWVGFAGDKRAQCNPMALPARNVRAWLLMAFFGVGTGAYTLVLAWLPPYYIELGWPAANAGYLLGALTLTEVVAGFMVSSLIHRFPDRRAPLALAIFLVILGLGCLIGAPRELATLATILLGLGIGALFPLSLIVTLDHAKSPGEAGSLLAFVQGGGYLIAGTMPFFAGVLRDEMASLRLVWAGMAIGVAVLLILCRRFSPKRAVAQA
ncbi:MFS transporter [Pseudomonas sp. RIT-PI-S]|uniref:MFS transporter n=1 Tax=Pseudomonas sp. RIT-PI-S TaxID=3035295 RepID=UPI0021DAEA88|nr:MFS transporter [Pseudomonas sp. RIT-PI-S]